MGDLERALEAVLFAVGEPVSLERLTHVLACTPEDLAAAAARLKDQLSYERHGIRLVRLEDSWQLCTAPDLADSVTAALETRKPARLSASALETLAIIAYYQPTTKVYVEQLRGVDSAYSVGTLLRRELIEECGRLEVPGRPILYRTTPAFLRVFGLESLQELPELEQLAGADSLLQTTQEVTAHAGTDNHPDNPGSAGSGAGGSGDPVPGEGLEGESLFGAAPNSNSPGQAEEAEETKKTQAE